MAQCSKYFIIHRHSLKLYITCYITVSVYFTWHQKKTAFVLLSVVLLFQLVSFSIAGLLGRLWTKYFVFTLSSSLQIPRQNFKLDKKPFLPLHESLFVTPLVATKTENSKQFLNKSRITYRPLTHTSRQMSSEVNLKLPIRAAMSLTLC